MDGSDRKIVFNYELTGIVFIIIIGSILHFTFELSGQHPVVGVFSAVNESVWEHLKLGFWPALVWILIEYRFIRNSTNNFILAKTVGIYLIPIFILVSFYSYTAVIGESVLVIDILTFVLAVMIGQLISYKLLTYERLPVILRKISLVALLLLGFAFMFFTFYPPHLPIFKDLTTGEYGIAHHLILCEAM